MQLSLLVRCFNSIKVRLNHPSQDFNVDAATFQFHKGTIKPVL